MNTTAIADLICAVFMGILYARNFSNRALSKSSRLLNLCLAVMLTSILIDAAAYTFIGPAYPVAFRFFINLLTFEATCVNVILFTFYEEALFEENGKVNPWFFRVIKIVEIFWAFATAYEFIAGHLITYGTNGVENLDYAFPTYIVVLNLMIQFYLVAITIVNSRKIGKDLALLLSIFFIAPIITSILFSFLGVDFAYAFGAVMLGLVAEFIQRKQTQKVQQEQIATQELANQQRYLKSFGDMVNAALWSISINGANEVTGVKWSDEVRHMLGLTAEEYPNRLEAWLERLHPDDRDKTEEVFNKGLDTTDTDNYVYDLEYRLRKKSGEYCWYHALGRMEYNDDGTRKLYGIIYDLTADKKLEEKQEQLEKALNAANLETRRNDVLTNIISGSKFTYDISADDEIVGAHYSEVSIARIGEEYTKTPLGWFELLHPEDKKRVYNAFMATVRDHSGKTLYNETFRMMGTNGNYRWVRSGGNVIRRADGSGEFLGISLDMTRQMEEQQKRLLGAMPLSNDVLAKANIGMWAFELDEGQLPRMYDDETMLRLVGLDHQVPPEEAYHAWYDHIDEGSYDLVNDAVAKMMDGEHAEVQYPWHYPDGRTIIVRCGGIRNYEYTKGIRIEGTHQNVTETLHFDEKAARHQQLELVASKMRAEMLAYISDHEPDVDKFVEFFGRRVLEATGCDQIIFRNMDGHRIVVNAQGIADVPQSICAECAFSKFQDDQYGDNGIVLMNNCSEGCLGVMTHPDCPAKSSFMQKVYSDDKLVGLLTIHYLKEYHEFTENDVDIMKTVGFHLGLLLMRIAGKKSEMERLKAESANAAKTDFLFSMSHDIRTPMNAISGFTNMAIKHIDDKEKVLDCLEKTQRSGAMLLSLINNILEVSRIESGKVTLEEQPGDIYYSFANIESTMREMAETKDIDLNFEFGEIRDRFVYADFSRCMRVFVNIISNAIKYTHEGGFLKVRCEQIGTAEDGYARYRYTFTDNGIGMSKEFLEHVFDQFSREKNSTVSGIEGSGLGLSVVKSFTELMGGTIEVSSTQGKGSTFTVILPFKLQNKEDYTDPLTGEIVSSTSGARKTESIDFTGRSVLLVEDNGLNREIAIEILEEEGLMVEDADDGTTAVEILREKGPDYYDFILMDIQMPVMNGYEATKTIREMYPDKHVPIIALSANAFAEDKKKSLEAGMDDHVAKPINIKELFTALAKFL